MKDLQFLPLNVVMNTIEEKDILGFCKAFGIPFVVNILLPNDEPQRLSFHDFKEWNEYLADLAGSVDMKEVQASL
tara:strand:- start:782 stop:1006 length:225 start_codon:yes stop_codon:yes gene_type:complete